MAFFGKIKRAFGFSEVEYEEEENNEIERSAAVTPLNRQRQAPVVQQPAETTPQRETSSDIVAKSDETAQLPTAVPDEIFDTVVRIFNDAQPSFIKEHLDPEAQRRHIYNALDTSMKDYIARIEQIARTRTEIEWREERDRLKVEMDNLQSRSKKMEDTNAEWKEQKLSAERQKRALSERVHDLEKQIVAYEAEKEQYELENKSLVNKLRAMSVQEGEAGSLAEENNSLREEIVRLKNAAANTPAEADHKAIEDLTKEKESLLNDIAMLKKRCEIADAMINDLNHRASTAQKSLGERESQLSETRLALESANREIEEVNSRLEALQNAPVNDESAELREENDRLRNRVETTDTELTKAREELEELHKSMKLVEESLDKFEEIKSSKDSQIAKLKAELESSRQDLENADTQISSLKSTIENNLKLQASSEAALRQEIENLKNSSEYSKPKRRKRPKISSIDDTLDDTDWLVATPPAGTNARPSGVSDAEFGYQEPRRKENPPENSAQMSLW